MEQEGRIYIKLNGKYPGWFNSVKDSYILYIRGYAFIGDQYFSGDTLIQYISNSLDNILFRDHISFLKNLVIQLNGCWTLIYKANNKVFASVDRFRSIPLFYAIDADRFLLSDDAGIVLKQLNYKQLDDICAAEFLVTGYVTGRDTLYKGLSKILPGEILEANTSGNSSVQLNAYQYYRFIFGNYYDLDEQELEEELSNVLDRAFCRYATALKGKKPVISLSGGLDSRLIAAMLRKCGINNVICSSYGKQGNIEAEISKEVAKTLDYEWIFCPYDYPSWYRWFREEQSIEYMKYASNKSSYAPTHYIPYTKFILDNVPGDDIVFITGYSGDFLAGSYVPEKIYNAENANYDSLVQETILHKDYCLWEWRDTSKSLEEAFLERIKKVLPDFSSIDKYESIGAYETWQFENNQATYIINLMRVYEFFGCEWMLPLFDYELMDFFLRVKADLRYQKKLYRNVLLHKVFADNFDRLAAINIAGFLSMRGSANQGIKHNLLGNAIYNLLKRITPASAKDLIRDFRSYRDRYNDDILAIYGKWKYIERRKKGFLKLLNTKLAKSLSISIEKLPQSAKSIIEPYMNKPVLACPFNSIESAYCLATIIH